MFCKDKSVFDHFHLKEKSQENNKQGFIYINSQINTCPDGLFITELLFLYEMINFLILGKILADLYFSRLGKGLGYLCSNSVCMVS
jgi:hypothetical protein